MHVCKECSFSFRCRCTAECCPYEVAYAFVAALFSKILAFHIALYYMHNIILLVSWCFVLGVDQSLSKGVAGLEVYWVVVFTEDLP